MQKAISCLTEGWIKIFMGMQTAAAAAAAVYIANYVVGENKP